MLSQKLLIQLACLVLTFLVDAQPAPINIGGSQNDGGVSLAIAPDGGYFVLGSTRSFGSGSEDIALVKLSDNGGVEWCRYIGSEFPDIPTWIEVLPDGDIVITGYGSSHENNQFANNVCLVRYDKNGIQKWIDSFYARQSYCVKATSDGGFVQLGLRSVGGQSMDLQINKFSNTRSEAYGRKHMVPFTRIMVLKFLLPKMGAL